MSIRKLLLVGAVLCSASILVTLIVLYLSHGKSASLSASQSARYQSFLLADELRQSSDDLTRLARTYVLSGDDKYEKMYWDILAIRNGDKARPQHMERIYWDLVLQYGEKPSPDGVKNSLTDLMKDAGFTDAEFAKLTEAQKNSNDLVYTETVAMNAVKGLYDDGNGNFTRKDKPDLAMARRIMHDNQYHQDKAKIVKPINEFLILLDERTSQTVLQKKQEVVFFGRVLITCLLMTLLTVIASLFFIYKGIMKQIGGEPKEVLAAMEKISNGQLSCIDVMATEGIAAGLVSMSESLRSTIENVKETANQVSVSATELSVISSQTNKGAKQQFVDMEQVATAMNEMSATVSDVAQNAEDALNSVMTADGHVQEGNRVIENVTGSAKALSEEVNSISDVIQELTVETDKIATVLNVIGEIAEQTNLLALNAAIEAARAGEQGRGFAVVADEVRTLASRTQHSTSEIQEIISSLQQGAQRATSVMSLGLEKAHDTLDGVEHAGENFKNISQSVAEINDRSAVIASASSQQSSAANEIDRSLARINEAANESAKGAEQTSDASVKLKELAQSLQDTVSHFST
ncbi:methyl-accepting chemotaxis protein [Marinomonas sp. 2405UD68-3]|uniref:methyl-accepting chemotaxis protein n=1 Tax=Marinomonas sp. 2405UD68-3 TaxID=3391835 RepID=UPI0039C9D27B